MYGSFRNEILKYIVFDPESKKIGKPKVVYFPEEIRLRVVVNRKISNLSFCLLCKFVLYNFVVLRLSFARVSP